jgi:predicted transcriptional regulator
MRTTIRMDDDLLEAAKAAAAGAGQTLTRFIEDAVRRQLAVRDHVESASQVDLPLFSGDGVHAGVDIDSNAALLDLMDVGR